MKDQIIAEQHNPSQLEKMYRADKALFKREFNALYPQLKDNALADFWNERLNYESNEIGWGTSKDLLFIIIASLLAGLIAKLPVLLSMEEDLFYQRNIGFIVLPLLTGYFIWKNKLSAGKIAFIAVVTLVCVIFINSLPHVKKSDTLILSCIHLALFLWSVLGFAFVGDKSNNEEKRLGFLRYNGDLVVMTTLILIAGALMSGITVGLFSLIGFKIEKYYFDYVGIFGLAAAPIVGTYLTQTNPQLVGKVSPVIARIFSPLVLVMLVIYLSAIVYSGKDPYNDREFLLIFNVLLVGVMAIIFFSIAGDAKTTKSKAGLWILFLLSIVTVVLNGIALSAILFRISEWGITPNRAAVLGSNILILINLLLVTAQLLRILSKKTDKTAVGKVISFYLPVYCLWTIIVTFLFPLIFGFK
ncbi:hypothetical protein BDE36_1454 [Arcticibacter tournemirensis]|uniref:DUF4153 domain-containing protein n=1 Tax=Arcticibacter tournemirensis TaxID=699437 RepID=A0A5M9H8E0_9SPHI|nr:hypothetical protein [Arcticibacter tournemirensis]KAA8482890.1 hypothetical protein F1649_10410 [Arcticibacter tournemirensis]TQM49729.1 hypothetical protein BDE36_1454 [Arcticibacter tournemirensis]